MGNDLSSFLPARDRITKDFYADDLETEFSKVAQSDFHGVTSYEELEGILERDPSLEDGEKARMLQAYKSHQSCINIITSFTTIRALAKADRSTKVKILKGREETFQAISDTEKVARKNFFAKNLDSVSKMPKSVQGLIRGESPSFLKSELEEYREDSRLSDEEREEVNKAIRCIDTAIEIDTSVYAIGKDLLDVPKVQDKLKRSEVLITLLNNKLIEQIKALPTGEKIIIPGGVPGHNIVYEFKRTGETDDKPTFQFKIFNSGLGNEAHPRSFLEMSGKTCRTYVINDVTLDQIQGSKSEPKKGLLYGLLSHAVGVNPSGYALKGDSTIPLIGGIINFFRTKSNISSIYRLVRATILSGKNPIEKNATSHKVQKQGSCARKAYNHVLKEDFFSPLNYKRFKATSTEHSITQLRALHEKNSSLLDENEKSSTTKKISGLRRYLFHTSYLARWFASLKNDISTESMLYLGEDILKKRQAKYEKLKPEAEKSQPSEASKTSIDVSKTKTETSKTTSESFSKKELSPSEESSEGLGFSLDDLDGQKFE